jgi:hypothetical protein
MNDSTFFSLLCATVLAIVSTTTHAALFDRGGGLIYDSAQNLTWTQNAGMSGYRSSWDDAMAWAENLEFGGYNDWRLPTTTPFDDPTCSVDVRAAGTFLLFYEHRLDCRGGEMELLTYLYDPWNNPLFINVNKTRYWMATPYRDWIDPCIHYPAYDVPCTIENDSGIRTDFYWQWGFTGFDGLNGPAYKTTLRGTNDRYAWAVRDGDVGAVSIPDPEIMVSDSAAPVTDLQMPFGNVIEMTSSDGTVTVTNGGDQDLVIGQIAVANPLAAPFSILNDNCSNQTLTTGLSCTLTVRYSPPVTGTSIDRFSIPSNDADEDPVTFKVSGTGISASAPEITVTDSVNPDDDLQVLFGEVTEMTSSDQTIRITNDGGTNLDIGQIAVANPLAAPFSILNDSCSNQTVVPAANCSLTVRFAPPLPGASNDSFYIPSNDGDENPVTVNVSGTGTEILPLDSNGDGISDSDAIALGLDPNDPDGDTDNDGQPDVIEVGADIENPMDNDGDGVIDALEPGVTASNAEIASGLLLASGDTVIITTAPGELLSNVRSDESVDGPAGIEFPFGTISYTTSAPLGGSVTVRMAFSANLPDTLVINKVDRDNNHTVLPDTVWHQVDNRSVDITLTDGDPQTDLDKAIDGSIEDPVAIGNAINAGGGGGGGVVGGGGGGGGGCTIGATANMDPTWLFILLAPGIRYLRRHRIKLKKVA